MPIKLIYIICMPSKTKMWNENKQKLTHKFNIVTTTVLFMNDSLSLKSVCCTLYMYIVESYLWVFVDIQHEMIHTMIVF